MDRALLVGINAYPAAPLRGCVHDVADMTDYLVSACGFHTGDIRPLTDEQATAQAIRVGLWWLTAELQPGDRALFQFSGHGAQIPAQDAMGNLIGLNEAICPSDVDWTDRTMISDRELTQIFNQIPDGVEAVWVSDSCHSGDLDHYVGISDTTLRARQLSPPHDLLWQALAAKDCVRIPPDPLENVVLLAACAKDQIAADVALCGRYTGAFTHYLLATLRDLPKLPLAAVLAETKRRLRIAGYAQDPQLRGSSAVASRAFLAPTPAARG